MTVEIKHRLTRLTGKILHTVNAAYLQGADLAGVDLRGADLTVADLREADLRGADLRGAYLGAANLQAADLTGAYLRGVDLRGANLRGANLWEADLEGADLEGTIMPDGRTYEQWRADPLAGLCATPKATNRAIAAWGAHTWQDCPMHAAHGWEGIEEAPEQKRQLVATFVALFDGLQLPAPQPQPGSENK